MNLSACSPRLLVRASIAGLAALSIFLGTAASASAQPAIAITAGPTEGSFTKDLKIVFALSATASPSKQVDFFCSLDNPALFSPCSPVEYPTCMPGAGGMMVCSQSISYGASEGQHTFRTFASDCTAPCEPADVGTDGPLVIRTFTVDRTVPIASIVSGPSPETPSIRSAPLFALTSNELGSFTCSLDGSPATACENSVTFPELFKGTHTLTVTAVDRAGNASAPVTRGFKVDRFKPRKCKQGKSAGAKAKLRKCKRANAADKAKWKKRNGIH